MEQIALINNIKNHTPFQLVQEKQWKHLPSLHHADPRSTMHIEEVPGVELHSSADQADTQ